METSLQAAIDAERSSKDKLTLTKEKLEKVELQLQQTENKLQQCQSELNDANEVRFSFLRKPSVSGTSMDFLANTAAAYGKGSGEKVGQAGNRRGKKGIRGENCLSLSRNNSY